jgi:hypothetical protein
MLLWHWGGRRMINRRRFSTSGLAVAGTLLANCKRAHANRTAGSKPVPSSTSSVLPVGPTREVRTLAAAARLARPGTTIEVDPGDYVNDVAVWLIDNVTVRAATGRVRLLVHGVAAEGKGIWVVRCEGMRVEGLDFEGCMVPSRNGAGIRLDRGSLHVKDCRFRYNEMGLLTNNDPATSLAIENCEFAYNQRNDGHNHNLYAGRIARLIVTGSYFHHAHVGHLLKTRAASNTIAYNRLTDESGGTASYELEFPNGGIAVVIGNLLAQNLSTENKHLVSYGAEGYTWQHNALYLANNTLINPIAQGGVYLRVAQGVDKIVAVNNLLVGAGRLESAGPGDFRNNLHATGEDFADIARFDLRLKADSPLIGRNLDVGALVDPDLKPAREYRHPRNTRPLDANPHNPGAMQSTAPVP